jgi:hypothetical protein
MCSLTQDELSMHTTICSLTQDELSRHTTICSLTQDELSRQKSNGVLNTLDGEED